MQNEVTYSLIYTYSLFQYQRQNQGKENSAVQSSSLTLKSL